MAEPLVAGMCSTTMIAAAFLLLQLVVLQSASGGLVSASPCSVNIYNEIPGQTIEVNCGSFGERPLAYGEYFGWGFRASIWGSTRWSCGFKWGAKVQEFYVWVDDGVWGTVPVRPCTHCLWRVRKEGMFRDGKYGTPILIYKWL